MFEFTKCQDNRAAFLWLSSLQAKIEKTPLDVLLLEVKALMKTLRLFHDSQTFVIRRLLGTVYSTLFSRLDPSSANDLFSEYLNNIKSDPTNSDALLSLHIVGCLAGLLAKTSKGLLIKATILVVKYLKANGEFRLRIVAIETLGCLLVHCTLQLPDPVLLDIKKIIKDCLQDSSMCVRKFGSLSLNALVLNGALRISSFAEYEALVWSVVKSMEQASYDTRIALAETISSILFVSHTPTLVLGSQNVHLSFNEMLHTLDFFRGICFNCREIRVGIAEALILLFKKFDNHFIFSNYTTIMDYIFSFFNKKFLSLSDNEKTCTKEIMVVVIRFLGRHISGNDKVSVSKQLLENYIAKDSSKWVLHVALRELSELFIEIGDYITPMDIFEIIFKVASHPSHLVQVSACLFISKYVSVYPSQLGLFLGRFLDFLLVEMGTVTINLGQELNYLSCRASIGISLIVCVLLHNCKYFPLYCPSALLHKALGLASSLLSSAISSNTKRGQGGRFLLYEISWNILTGLMTSGSSTISHILPQFHLLCKSCLAANWQSLCEVSYFETIFAFEAVLKCTNAMLLHECFPQETIKIISALASKAVEFATLSPHGMSPTNTRNLLYLGQNGKLLMKKTKFFINFSITVITAMFRKRLFQTLYLLPTDLYADLHLLLLKLSNESLSSEKVFDTNSAEKNNFHVFTRSKYIMIDSFKKPMWTLAENGTSTISPFSLVRDADMETIFDYAQWKELETLLEYVVCPANEYDILSIFKCSSVECRYFPPIVDCINCAIRLHSSIFAQISQEAQEFLLDGASHLSSFKNEKDTQEQKIAYTLNFIFSMHFSLGRLSELSRCVSLKFAKCITELCSEPLRSTCISTQYLASVVIGQTAEIAGPNFYLPLTTFLKDEYHSNNLGSVFSLVMMHVHSKSVTYLDYTIDCIRETSKKSEWCIFALKMLVVSPRLSGVLHPFVHSIISLVFDLLNFLTHPIFLGAILQRCIDIMGPEISNCSETQRLLCCIIEYLVSSDGYEERSEGWLCLSHLLVICPNAYPATYFTKRLVCCLNSTHMTFRRSCLECLVRIIQRYADKILASTQGIELSLLNLIEDEPDLTKCALDSLVEVSTGPSTWIDNCIYFLNPGQEININQTNLNHDDVETLVKSTSVPQRVSKWICQVQSLIYLRFLILRLAKRAECGGIDLLHFEVTQARQVKGDWLVLRLPDLIRIAFMASTASGWKVRRQGLELLECILDTFSSTNDPDYEGHKLLEQYQAQFTSALSPAFTHSAEVETIAHASKICAKFIGKRITDELFTISRIVEMLESGLKLCKPKVIISSELSQKVCEFSVLSAWADLCLFSNSSTMVSYIMEPRLKILIPVWLNCLFEYSSVKFHKQKDFFSINRSRIFRQAILAREVLLKSYSSTWISILAAVTSKLDSTSSINVSDGNFKFEAEKKYLKLLLGLSVQKLFSFAEKVDDFKLCLKSVAHLTKNNNISDESILVVLQVFSKILQFGSLELQALCIEYITDIVNSNHISFHLSEKIAEIIVTIISKSLPNVHREKSNNIFEHPKILTIRALNLLGRLAICCDYWIPLMCFVYSAACKDEIWLKSSELIFILKECCLITNTYTVKLAVSLIKTAKKTRSIACLDAATAIFFKAPYCFQECRNVYLRLISLFLSESYTCNAALLSVGTVMNALKKCETLFYLTTVNFIARLVISQLGKTIRERGSQIVPLYLDFLCELFKFQDLKFNEEFPEITIAILIGCIFWHSAYIQQISQILVYMAARHVKEFQRVIIVLPLNKQKLVEQCLKSNLNHVD